MLIKQRIELTKYVQSMNITSNNYQTHFTPFRKRKSNSTSIRNHSIGNMRASTSISQTQQPVQHLRSKSFQKETIQLDNGQKLSKKFTAKMKRRFHITDSQHHNLSAIQHPRYIGNRTEMVITQRVSQAASVLQTKKSTIESITVASKINFAKKSKTGKELVLNDSHFQSWMNEVLVQTCNQKFDTTVTLAAVKKYMVDSASLAAFGIKSADISRIYRSLHIYSVGFSKMLKEMRGISTKVYRNIWKVYSILLEYCSAGDFQTMLSEMCNQNGNKIEELEDELQEKQEVIEKNEELNREKNSKVFKELKALKEENFQLNLEKDVIINDCKDFQKAFGEEVSLRILFQDKINSIYSLYRELSDKHSTLFSDFQTKISEISSLTEQNKKITEEIVAVKKQKHGIELDKQILNQEVNQLRDQLSKIQKKLALRSSQQNQLKLQRSNFNKQLLQAQQSSKRLAKQLQNAQDNNKLLQDTYHLLQLQYEQCLKQNKRLIQTLDLQFNINKSYFQQRQTLDQGMVNYQNQKAVFQQKIAYKDNLISQQTEAIKELKESLNCLKNDKEIAYENIQQLRQNLRVADQNIANMKVINDENQKVIYQQKQTIKYLGLELQKIKKAKEMADNQIKQLKKEVFELDSVKISLQSEINQLKKRFNSELKARQKSLQAQAQQKKQQDSRYSIVAKDLVSKQTQFQKYKQLFQSTNIKLNNERFEKKNLQLSYKQCLTVIENNTSVIKEIRTKHSDLQERLQEEKINHKLKEIKLQSKITELNKLNNKITQQNDKITTFNKQHKDCVHPMFFEDAVSHIARIQQRKQNLEELAKVLKQIYKQSEQSLKHKDQEIIVLSQKLKQTQYKSSLEVQYQRKKNQELSELLDQSELKILALANKQKVPVVDFRQKERMYLEIIRQKRQETQNLLSELEVMQDQNQRLVAKINNSESQLNSQRQRLADFQSELGILQGEKRQLQSQRDSVIQQMNLIKKDESKHNFVGFNAEYSLNFKNNQNARLNLNYKADYNAANHTAEYNEQLQTNEAIRKKTFEYDILIRKSNGGKSLVLGSISPREKTKQLYQHRQFDQNSQNLALENQNGIPKDQSYPVSAKEKATEKSRREDFSKKFKIASQYYLK